MFLLFVACLFVLCIVQEVDRSVHHLLNESWPRLEGVVSPSSAVSWWEGNTDTGVGARLSSDSYSDWHW